MSTTTTRKPAQKTHKARCHGQQFKAAAVAEALAGKIADVARQKGVTIRTLQRWIKRSKEDGPLSRAVERKTALIERDWAEDAKAAMRSMLGNLVATVAKATTEDGPVPEGRIREIAGAIKVVGELGVAKEMFSGRAAQDHRQDGAAIQAPRQAGATAAECGVPLN